MANEAVLSGVEAYANACHTTPQLERRGRSRDGVGLYGWQMPTTREVHIPETQELTLSVHLGGARRVRVYTESGLSQTFSRPGDITLIPRGQSIHYRTDGRVDFATVHFPAQSACVARDRIGTGLLNLPHCLFALRDEYVVATVQTLIRAKSTSSPDDQRYFAKLLDSLTWHLARVVEDGNAETVRLPALIAAPSSVTAGANFDAVIAWIDANLAEKMTLDELADRAGIGRTTFAQQFARRFGCPPHRYIMIRRMEKARAMLHEGRLRVTDIAYELGFSSQSHFSTAYKAINGETPREVIARIEG
ncbi:helix-turn-helix domain-containing protein [Panacagrimonas sp.]|uniref:helix-turn-helix domain-containing protein n=1 Tax=Panacagrimonas sp. TaxID=2480088 RepID=UPI003B525F38